MLRSIPARIGTVALIVLSLVFGSTGPAGTGTAAAADLEDVTPELQIFLPWGDPLWYVELPGGSAENAANWSLIGNAYLSAENEPWQVWGADHERSVRVGTGGYATLKTWTVLSEDIRFFVKAPAWSSSWLTVT